MAEHPDVFDKKEAYALLNLDDTDKNFCPACEWDTHMMTVHGTKPCTCCPIWGNHNNKNTCSCEGYGDWESAQDEETRKISAEKILNAAIFTLKRIHPKEKE